MVTSPPGLGSENDEDQQQLKTTDPSSRQGGCYIRTTTASVRLENTIICRLSQGTCRQDELIGANLPVVKWVWPWSSYLLVRFRNQSRSDRRSWRLAVESQTMKRRLWCWCETAARLAVVIWDLSSARDAVKIGMKHGKLKNHHC
jgi:hypothetical protein